MKKIFAATLCLFAALSFAEQIASPFSLQGHDKKTYSLADFKGKHVVLEWYNYGCPFVRRHYDNGAMQDLQKKYTKKNVIWLSITSSAPTKQGFLASAEEAAKKYSEEKSAATAVLLDHDGKVGKLYGAKTTPHMFIINPKGELIYQGAIDNVPGFEKDEKIKTINYVSEALDQSLSGKKVDITTTTAYGCSVKY